VRFVWQDEYGYVDEQWRRFPYLYEYRIVPVFQDFGPITSQRREDPKKNDSASGPLGTKPDSSRRGFG
jgi:hypothetical protein